MGNRHFAPGGTNDPVLSVERFRDTSPSPINHEAPTYVGWGFSFFGRGVASGYYRGIAESYLIGPFMSLASSLLSDLIV